MRLHSYEKLVKNFSLIFVAFLGLSLTAQAGPVERRAVRIEQSSQSEMKDLSLRFKIIRTRALILYLENLIPAKGNPYYHMAQFADKYTKESFKAAQKNNSPAMKEVLWLPIAHDRQIKKHEFDTDTDLNSVVTYFAKWVATTEVLKDLVQTTLEDSILVGSLEESIGQENSVKFKASWKHIEYLKKNYIEKINEQQALSDLIVREKKKATLAIASIIAENMKPSIDYVKNSTNSKALDQFLKNVQELSTLSVSKKDLTATMNKVLKISNGADYTLVKSALNSVDLPDSGDIDGAEESFEVVMRLDVGFDILKRIFLEVQSWQGLKR